MKKISILLVDDHRLVREFWVAFLNTDANLEVVASTGYADKAVELAAQLSPDVVLMDINLIPYSGIEATKKIRLVSPRSNVIGVSMYTQPAYVRKLFEVGARGYLSKNSPKEEMIQAIIAVYKGNKYICREIVEILAESIFESKKDLPGLHLLSDREMEIINMVKTGSSSREIAQTLQIATKTVEVHRQNIMKKLKINNTASLVNFINNSIRFA